MLPPRLARWLSWIIPLRAERMEGRFGRLDVRWTLGRKVLDSATANQSFGSLHRVWQVVLRGLHVAERPPGRILLLGLGGGSALHILRNDSGIRSPITAVEIDPVVVDLARRHFGLDGIPDVDLVIGDATIQVHALPMNYDLVLVDLFNDLDLAAGVDSRAFVKGLRSRCTAGGTVCVNTVEYNATSAARCDTMADLLREHFDHVRELREEEVNRVFIAW